MVYQPKNSMSLKTCLTEKQKEIEKQVSDIKQQPLLEMEHLLNGENYIYFFGVANYF